MRKYKVFIACDTTSIKKIKEIIKNTKNKKLKIGYKFGLEFLNSKNGRKFVSTLKNTVKFGDYKISDIPNTTASTIKAIKDLRYNYITIHTNCGLDALKAAKKVAGKSKLVGVTTLTSLNNKSLKDIGFNENINKVVLKQAMLASRANLEVKMVKKVFAKEIITPGIRLDAKVHDQERVLTPKQAYKNGSDWLVIGRPITKGNIKKNIKKLIDHLNK